MKQILGAFRRTSFGTLAALFLLTIVGVALPSRDASAAGLLDRSLKLTSSQFSDSSIKLPDGTDAPAGSAANGQKVGHTYLFKTPTGGSMALIQFQYCDDPFGYLEFAPDNVSGACTDVTGFTAANVTAATVAWGPTTAVATGSQPYQTNTTTPVHDTDELRLEPTSTAATPAAGDYVRVTIAATSTNYFVNPTSAYADGLANGDKSFFAHIETYTSAAQVNTANVVDEGTVVSSGSETIAINTRVQETLKFSAGSDAPADDGGSGCTALPNGSAGALKIGDPVNNALDPTLTYDGHSWFRLSTNAGNGVEVLYAGKTLESAAGDTITAIGATETAAATGVEQFGLGIDEDGTQFNFSQLTAAGNYDGANQTTGTTDSFAFDPTSDTAPVPIASAGGFVACDTGAVRYAANIAPDTEAGIYSTKINYIAVPSY